MPNTEMQPMTLVEKHLLNDTTLLMKLKPSTAFDYQS
jgi:CDP-4-dehydro-6-deoxyglucose reductase